jgi:hypothetical protein
MLRDLKYIERRARQERQASTEATSGRAREIHADLARRYEDILRAYGQSEKAA